MTKAEEKKEIQSLRRKAFHLWAKEVKNRAGNQCESWEEGKRCEKDKFLNAHHIESYVLNKELRYDLRNGACFCPSHHKFKRKCAHRSFIFMYDFMTHYRLEDLYYLITRSDESHPETKESLLNSISKLIKIPVLIKRIK